jgi:hypothetical protein
MIDHDEMHGCIMRGTEDYFVVVRIGLQWYLNWTIKKEGKAWRDFEGLEEILFCPYCGENLLPKVETRNRL